MVHLRNQKIVAVLLIALVVGACFVGSISTQKHSQNKKGKNEIVVKRAAI
jgi:hypothetical protein